MTSGDLAYCPTCGKSVEFETRNRQTQGVRDGKSFKYRVPRAICPHCKSELDYAPYRQAEQAAFERACANGKGLITPDQIKEIPKKYAIGKRPLSRLLGWGELTYTRLMEGNIPTAEHSAELLELLDDPTAFAQLLQRGYDRGIITETALKRSLRAIRNLIGAEVDTSNQLSAVADRLCVLAEGELTPLGLQTLLYYVHGHSTVELDEPIINTLPIAGPKGPEYPNVRKGYTFDDIQATYHHAVKRARAMASGHYAVDAAKITSGLVGTSGAGNVGGNSGSSGAAKAVPTYAAKVNVASVSARAERSDNRGKSSDDGKGADITTKDVERLFAKAEEAKAKKGKKSKKYKKALKAAEDAKALLESRKGGRSAADEAASKAQDDMRNEAQGAQTTVEGTSHGGRGHGGRLADHRSQVPAQPEDHSNDLLGQGRKMSATLAKRKGGGAMNDEAAFDAAEGEQALIDLADQAPDEVFAPPQKPAADAASPSPEQAAHVLTVADTLHAMGTLLTVPQMSLIDRVYHQYGYMSSQALSQKARTESPWLEARQSSSDTITIAQMQAFFAEHPLP